MVFLERLQTQIIGGNFKMLNKSRNRNLVLIACLSFALMGIASPAALAQSLTAEDIIEKNIAARGGLSAWRDIQTMTMTGRLDAGNKQSVQLPYVLKLKRDRMSRLEIEFAGKTALQVYDGTNGWKVRPFLNRMEVEPFTQAELDGAAEQQQLDGFLINHAAKGIKAEFVGIEPVEGHNAYKLKLTLPNGNVRNLWVDASSYLEVKVEGVPRRLDGKMHNVEVFYRDYRKVGGVMIPFVLETVVENVSPNHKITVETVNLNPKFDDGLFAKPDISLVHAVKQAEGGSR
jgi:hypothetical protein